MVSGSQRRCTSCPTSPERSAGWRQQWAYLSPKLSDLRQDRWVGNIVVNSDIIVL